jgi:hypothetical protein
MKMTYIPNQQHRDTSFSNQKSQWTINILEEKGAYSLSSQAGWITNSSYYGLHLIDNRPQKLGISPTPSTDDLYMCKFVENQSIWHGYPVAHWASPWDKPSPQVLNDWMNLGYINKAKLSKIHRGRKCAL